MKRKTKVVTAAASSLTIASIGTAYNISKQFAKKMVYRDYSQQSGLENWYESINAKKIRIKNHKDLALQAYLIEKKDPKTTLVCLHPFMKSSKSLTETVQVLGELFSDAQILLVDAFAHGGSDGYIRGFGYNDIFDLMYFNTYLLQKYGEDHKIIMYGHGIGANTILNAAGLGKLKNVELIISEGACDNVYNYLAYRCQKETSLSQYVCGPVIRQVIKKETGADIKKMDTYKLIKDNFIPTIYVHSKLDEDVSFKTLLNLYNRNKERSFLFPLKERYLFERLKEKDDYTQSFINFIEDTKGGL